MNLLQIKDNFVYISFTNISEKYTQTDFNLQKDYDFIFRKLKFNLCTFCSLIFLKFVLLSIDAICMCVPMKKLILLFYFIEFHPMVLTLKGGCFCWCKQTKVCNLYWSLVLGSRFVQSTVYTILGVCIVLLQTAALLFVRRRFFLHVLYVYEC